GPVAMSISTRCPHCATSYRLVDQQSGRTVRCQKCSRPFRVEGAVSTSENVTSHAPPTHAVAHAENGPPSRPAETAWRQILCSHCGVSYETPPDLVVSSFACAHCGQHVS